MRKRTAHRWQLTLIMVIGVFVAAGSFWLVQLVNQAGGEAQADMFRNEPDYIIDRFSMVRMNKEGQPAYIISGDKLTHHPVDDSSDIAKPIVHALSAAERPPMHINADSAHVDQGNTRVRLDGNVDVVRPATAKTQAMRMKTPTLTVFPDEERMETVAPVDLQLGGTTSTGTGMRFNNATRQVQLGGRGTITMPPRAAK